MPNWFSGNMLLIAHVVAVVYHEMFISAFLYNQLSKVVLGWTCMFEPADIFQKAINNTIPH